MSVKTITHFYVPVYRDLMMVPDYVKHFQSKAIGSMYTLLVSRVWRRGHDWTKAEGYFGPILDCAREFDGGSLCAFIADQDLADLLGVSRRYVRILRQQLIDLGLVEAHKTKHKTTRYFYKVGEVRYDGSETMFIENWLTQVSSTKYAAESEADPSDVPFVIQLRELSNEGSSPRSKSPRKSAAQQEDAPSFCHGAELQFQKNGTTVPEPREFGSEIFASGTGISDEQAPAYKEKNINHLTYVSNFPRNEPATWTDNALPPSGLAEKNYSKEGRGGMGKSPTTKHAGQSKSADYSAKKKREGRKTWQVGTRAATMAREGNDLKDNNMQSLMFDPSETAAPDLSYINEMLSPTALGRAIVKEVRRVGKKALKAHFIKLLSRNGIFTHDLEGEVMFFSTAVDRYFKAFPPQSETLTTPIMTWWKALSVDLGRPDLIKDAKNTMVVLSKIRGLNSWDEFSYLIRLLSHEQGGMLNFCEGFQHVTWLTTAVNKNVFKLRRQQEATRTLGSNSLQPLSKEEAQKADTSDIDELFRKAQEQTRRAFGLMED